tara:strand:+ start:12 stop:320 length:309 start_codon:yes stop_codon:yes gene_type:complete
VGVTVELLLELYYLLACLILAIANIPVFQIYPTKALCIVPREMEQLHGDGAMVGQVLGQMIIQPRQGQPIVVKIPGRQGVAYILSVIIMMLGQQAIPMVLMK